MIKKIYDFKGKIKLKSSAIYLFVQKYNISLHSLLSNKWNLNLEMKWLAVNTDMKL